MCLSDYGIGNEGTLHLIYRLRSPEEEEEEKRIANKPKALPPQKLYDWYAICLLINNMISFRLEEFHLDSVAL